MQSSLEPFPTKDALEAILHFISALVIGPYSSYSAYPVCEMESPAYLVAAEPRKRPEKRRCDGCCVSARGRTCARFLLGAGDWRFDDGGWGAKLGVGEPYISRWANLVVDCWLGDDV